MADDRDKAAQDAIEGRTGAGGGRPAPSERLPNAHADPDLVNPDATPGTGALPTPGEPDDVDSTSG